MADVYDLGEDNLKYGMYLFMEVNINNPFMFVIRDKETGEVWFTGAVYEPVLWKNVKSEYGR